MPDKEDPQINDAAKILLRLSEASNEEVADAYFAEGTSPFTNTSYHKRSTRYVCQIRVDGKRTHVGYADRPEEAARLAIKFFKEHNITGKRLSTVETQLALWDRGIRPAAS